MKKLRIEEVEPRFAEELEGPFKSTLKRLGYAVPENFRLRVSLLQANRRKKRSNAGSDTWVPGSERIEFWLEPSADVSEAVGEKSSERAVAAITSAQNSVSQQNYVHPAEAELLHALFRAESTPGWSFVALKKFRDEILPSEDTPSIRSDVERQSVLRSAIEKKLVLTKTVPNPKSPQFPVTSIRVNRLLPEVVAVLGLPKKDLAFHPIHIKGEPLSSVILRERR
jgi:hypothetical protein